MIIKEYEKMIGKYNYKYISTGSEAIVYSFQNKVLKDFHKNLSKEMLQRKKEILLLLSEIEELKKYYPEIKYLCENKDGILSSYVMKRIYGITLSSRYAKFSIQDVLKIVARLKVILAEFRKYGFLYLDIRYPNIMINFFKQPTLVDIDGITTLENPHIDILPDLLRPYIENNGKPNEYSQNYMLNILTLSLLHDVLSSCELDKDGEKILNSYQKREHCNPDTIFDHECLIDHIKRR